MIARRTLFFLIIILPTGLMALGQGREGSGVISGKVTLDGKPAAGVLLVLSEARIDQNRDRNMMQGSPVTRTGTDSRGHYQFAKLADGIYTITPFAPSLTREAKAKFADSITITEGEQIDGVDFDLRSGAVITGTVTSADGRPVIGQNVGARPDIIGEKSNNTATSGSARTDDRGIYRIFGLAPGSYRVETTVNGLSFLTGASTNTPGSYRDHDDPSKPGVVILAPGSEATGIDIRLAPPEPTFEAAGRVVDESGRAVPNVNVLCEGEDRHPTFLGGDSMGPQTNEMGEFKIRGLKSGKYSVAPFTLFMSENEYYGHPVKFEVTGHNVTGLGIKVRKGMTAAGQVVLEGTENPEALAKLQEQQVVGATEGGTTGAFNLSKSSIGPGGEFALHGLAPGKLHLALGDLFRESPFYISRIEVNGSPQKEGIPVEPGQDLTGLKTVVLYANSALHGRVIVTGGKLPKSTRLMVSVARTGADPTGSGDLVDERRRPGSEPIYVDPSGNFKLDGLLPGDYEVTVEAQTVDSINGSLRTTGKPKLTSQAITLANGQDIEITLTVDLAGVNTTDK